MEEIFESKHTSNELEAVLDKFSEVSQIADVFKNIKIVRIEADVFEDSQQITLLGGIAAENIVSDMNNGVFYYAKIYLVKYIGRLQTSIRCVVPIVSIEDVTRGGNTLGIDLPFGKGTLSWNNIDGWLYES